MPSEKKSSKISKKEGKSTFELPPQVSSMSSVIRSRQELEKLLSKARTYDANLDKIQIYDLTAELMSPEVKALFAKNDIKTADEISDLRDWLESLRQNAPRVHVTLAGATPRSFAEQLVTWFRDEIYENLLVDFHVSHEIGGGFILRTSNKIHDFSWRHRLNKNPMRVAELVKDAR